MIDRPGQIRQTSQTRSTRQPTHLLHTPDAFVRTPLPGLRGGVAIVHAAPALGAGFLHYTAELGPGGSLAPAAAQRFVYVLAGKGSLSLEAENYTEGAHGLHPLRPGAFAYLPAGERANLTAGDTQPGQVALRLSVIEKRYEPLHGVVPPAARFGYEDEIAGEPLNGDPDVSVRALLGSVGEDDPLAFDFAVNTMTYAPGASLAQVEVHVMEHGMVMLAGGGTYRLGESFHAVAAEDFIWMAPFCPQWFGALGTEPAKYLIYKNWNRGPAL